MSERPLVTIIVPVYNVKPYLKQCFDSIAGQTYGNFQLILVDDGSTDGSGDLCDELARADRRARVIHKDNAGPSEARNTGLRQAEGDWVAFVDSDDYVSPVFIEVLLHAALSTGCRISCVPSGAYFKDGDNAALAVSADDLPDPEVHSAEDMQRMLLYQEVETGYQWHFFARDVLGEDPCPKGLVYEDLASMYRLVHRVDSVALVRSSDLYAYRMRASGLIRQAYNHRKGASALIVTEQLYREIDDWYPELRVAAASRCFSVCRMTFAQIPTGKDATTETEKDRADVWGVLKKHRKTVLHDNDARKRERIAACFACMGEGAFSVFCALCKATGKM